MTTKYFFIMCIMIFGISINAQKVGVGTDDPSDKLHINDAAGNNALRVQVSGMTKLRVLSNGGVTIGANNVAGTPSNGLYVSGNMGVGVSNPNDKIAVNGNVNMTGEIKPNGTKGASGQVLTADGAGGMTWDSPCRFPNFKDFRFVISNEGWTVPAGVTQIQIEFWGSGGGGAFGGGGGAGGYMKTIIPVTAGEVLTVNLGRGGDGVANGQTIDADNGELSTIASDAGWTLTATGGIGAKQTNNGNGGTVVSSQVFNNVMVVNGEDGYYNEVTLIASDDRPLTYFGRGGNTPYAGRDTGGKGESFIDGPVGNDIENRGTDGLRPGGGGGGGHHFGQDGGDAYAIVRW